MAFVYRSDSTIIMLRTFISSWLCYTVWCADPKVMLQQTFPVTQIVNNYKTIVAEKDVDVFLACVVDNKPDDKMVQWMIQNYMTNTTIPISSDTDTHNAFKYQIDKPAANNWRLKIQNVQESDQALYICRVQLSSQQWANDSRLLNVIQKPQIIDIYTSSDSTKQEGEPMTLTCGASGLPTPIVTWQMVGGGILPTGGREYTAPKLIIDDVRKEHLGDYKCIAQNVAGTDVRRIYLNVLFQPQLSPADSEVVYQAVGYRQELRCVASGNPVPTEMQILWYKDGVPLYDQNKYIFDNYFGSNYVLMKLTISNINENDFGKYRCFVENSRGSGESFITLSRSAFYVDNNPNHKGGSALLTFSLTTLTMVIAISLLHFC